MRKITHHILSLIFAGGLLISTIGIPINKHYCGNTYITTTIGLPLKDPCGDMPMKGDCCNNDTHLLSITNFFNTTDLGIIKNVAPVMFVCNYTVCTKIIPQPVEIEFFKEYIPPPIESKIFVEIQSFLL